MGQGIRNILILDKCLEIVVNQFYITKIKKRFIIPIFCIPYGGFEVDEDCLGYMRGTSQDVKWLRNWDFYLLYFGFS